MNTNAIKSFAQKARLLLLDGVSQQLKYWGFKEDGTVFKRPVRTEGGFTFGQEVSNDTSLLKKWDNLSKKIDSAEHFKDTVEEASYTWFNRLMAIKILEMQGLIAPVLSYDAGTRTPAILKLAKAGHYELADRSKADVLRSYLLEDQDNLAFGLLLTDYCNSTDILKQVFGRIDDFTEILLPNNLLQADGLLDLINGEAISDDDYKEVELIGWLYQFYISDRKAEVDKKVGAGKKVRVEEIPAKTQIFTPKWIVKYMVENTVGKLYLDYEPSSDLASEMKYLVQNEDVIPGEVKESPVLGDVSELTIIDPACGSGHILVTAFDLLIKIYKEEGYGNKQAVEAILKNNLYGLDIDDRAMQLARFAVLIKAAQYDADILTKNIQPHVYSFPHAIALTREELHVFLPDAEIEELAEVRDALNLLNQGKNIGSALKLKISEKSRTQIVAQFEAWQAKEANGQLNLDEVGIWNKLKAHLEILLLLTKRYAAVVANPPYLGQKSMNADLKSYVNKEYPMTKSDLFAVFMEVCLELGLDGGLASTINQKTWTFQSKFKDLRQFVLQGHNIVSFLDLGKRIFEELSGEVVQSVAFVLCKNTFYNDSTFFRLTDLKSLSQKEASFLKRSMIYPKVDQRRFEVIPGSPISYWVSESVYNSFENFEKVKNSYDLKVGLQTGNNDLFRRNWYEVNLYKTVWEAGKIKKWFPYISGGGFRKWFGNLEYVVNWSDEGHDIINYKDEKGKLLSRPQNRSFYFRQSVCWSDIGSKPLGARVNPDGCLFDVVSMSAFHSDEQDLLYLSAFLSSIVNNYFLQITAPGMHYSIGYIGNNPFMLSEPFYNSVIYITKANVVISRDDWNSNETSWDFKQFSLINGGHSLADSFNKWSEQVHQDFFQLHQNEEELNHIFIEIYGLEEELSPEVALKDITILQEELDRKQLVSDEEELKQKGIGLKAKEEGLPLVPEGYKLPINSQEVMSQFLSYLVGLMMGRYRLDKPGLNIAHPDPSDEELSPYDVIASGSEAISSLRVTIDEDAILPLMGEAGAFPDDVVGQAKHLIQAIWGEESLTENINFLQEQLGMDMDKWYTEKFWPYHAKSMYKKKPIYWLFSSNIKSPQKAAFKVLVYMHRLDKYTVQKIQRHYLHPYQEQIKSKLEYLEANESSLAKQGLKELEKLRNWDTECRNYNEVLKDLANQQIEIDIDDGVTVNYAKFEGAVAKI